MNRHEKMLAEIEARGLTITRRGLAYWIRGPEVDVIVADLGTLTPSDLYPPPPSKRDHDPRAKR
jgi:hypothetical protein